MNSKFSDKFDLRHHEYDGVHMVSSRKHSKQVPIEGTKTQTDREREGERGNYFTAWFCFLTESDLTTQPSVLSGSLRRCKRFYF